ncbi:MAG TPA: hypothetical protein DCP51_03500 [Clostridiales bacterium]|nr:hypothetical protein [Clostridiales bacterium]
MVQAADIFEAIMVLSFGVSWPISIMKSLKARTAKGKSIFFLFLILFGYAAGITSKFIKASSSGEINYVTIFYILNFMLVGIDIILYFRNRKMDKIAEEKNKN